MTSRDNNRGGSTPDEGASGTERERELLPGWSSLVILLAIFALLSAITMMAIVRGEEVYVTHETGGTRAYRPADFPEIDFDEPLLPAVLAAEKDQRPGVFNVPPPPFTEGIFPCSECHADLEVNYEHREMEYMHEEIQLNHGPPDRWCFDCHNPDDRDRLRLANGKLIGFDESYLLCGQCHGTIFRDWREGIHGRRRGFWNGAKSYLLCPNCHNPHHPRFEPLEPLPPPVRPQFLGTQAMAGERSGEEPTQ